jgi:predicted aconitase with swiveling domain
LSAPALAGLREEAIALAHEAAEGMRAGRIAALPRHKGSCVNCMVRQTCGRAL